MKTAFEEISVLLIDDHQIFRDGIQSLLSGVRGIRVVSVASDGAEALQMIEDYDPDILLLDLTLPGMSGFDILDTIGETYGIKKVLILSMHIEEEYILKALKKGVMGYLPKQDTNREELINAIRSIYKGKEYFGDTISKIIREYSLNQADTDSKEVSEYEKLTKREKEILKLVVEGLSNQEIARKLFLSLRTIETHKNNLMHKLNMKNTVELVKYAIKTNLLQL